MSVIKESLKFNIIRKLRGSFDPFHLEVLNESNKHNVPKGSETHFKVLIVSNKFEGLSVLQRHRLINNTLRNEFENGLHALSIAAMSPEQWQKNGNNNIEPSPKCRGGSKI